MNGLVRFVDAPFSNNAPFGAPCAENLSTYTNAFGECSDSGCGCYRLKEPRVRVRFRNLVVHRTFLQLQAEANGVAAGVAASVDDVKDDVLPVPTTALSPVRYVSIGCGSLLTDVEILSGLCARGLRLELIVVVDPDYAPTRSNNRHLFESLAALFAPARVVAFESLGDLQRAAQNDPDGLGHCTTMLQIDANGISAMQANGLAARLLVPGGNFLSLSNDGARKSTTRCLQRKPDGPEGRFAPEKPDYVRALPLVSFRLASPSASSFHSLTRMDLARAHAVLELSLIHI